MVNQAGCVASYFRSVFAVADIIGNPKDLPRVKEYITLETKFDRLLPEKMIRL